MINKELFVETMEDIKKVDDYQKWLNSQLKKHGVDGCVFQPNCMDSVIKLLHFYFKELDKDDMISYFCFELDYGRNWKPFMVVDKDSNDINLSSSDYLYDYLVSQSNKEE